MRAVAVNVGANTTAPGVRGPVFPDGSFEFVPIPESAPTVEPPPTYADLALETDVPDPTQPVHLDPAFAEYPRCDSYTYGDPWGVKAQPLLELTAGDHVYFYATLTPRGTDHPDWVTPDWGAYLIGRFTLDRDPITGDEYETLSPAARAAYADNAHLRRDPFDAAVLLTGDPTASELFDQAVPLSGARGVDPNHLVTRLSADSGRGPWWRRPLRYDADAAETLATHVRTGPPVT
mgnify:CR=1 FL=1